VLGIKERMEKGSLKDFLRCFSLTYQERGKYASGLFGRVGKRI